MKIGSSPGVCARMMRPRKAEGLPRRGSGVKRSLTPKCAVAAALKATIAVAKKTKR